MPEILSQSFNNYSANTSIPRIVHHFWLTSSHAPIDIIAVDYYQGGKSYKYFLGTQVKIFSDFEHRFYAIDPKVIPETVAFVQSLGMTVIPLKNITTSYPNLLSRIEAFELTGSDTSEGECDVASWANFFLPACFIEGLRSFLSKFFSTDVQSHRTNLVDSFKDLLVVEFGGFVIDLNYEALAPIPTRMLCEHKFISGNWGENYFLGAVPGLNALHEILKRVEQFNADQWARRDSVYDMQVDRLYEAFKNHPDSHLLLNINDAPAVPCTQGSLDAIKDSGKIIVVGCDNKHMSHFEH